MHQSSQVTQEFFDIAFLAKRRRFPVHIRTSFLTCPVDRLPDDVSTLPELAVGAGLQPSVAAVGVNLVVPELFLQVVAPPVELA